MTKFNEHQAKIWQNMISLIDQYESHGTELNSLIRGLEGLLDTGEFKDDMLTKMWYTFWTPLEIYYADKLDTDEEVKKEEVTKDLDKMRQFLMDTLNKSSNS